MSQTVAADDTGIAAAMRLAEAFATETALNTRDAMRLGIIAEELVGNVVTHGRPATGSSITLNLGVVEDGVRIEMSDRGVAFDPRVTVGHGVIADGGPPDEEGGVGWPLINRWCRIEDYVRDGAENRLRLVMRADLNTAGSGALTP